MAAYILSLTPLGTSPVPSLAESEETEQVLESFCKSEVTPTSEVSVTSPSKESLAEILAPPKSSYAFSAADRLILLVVALALSEGLSYIFIQSVAASPGELFLVFEKKLLTVCGSRDITTSPWLTTDQDLSDLGSFKYFVYGVN